MKPHHQIVSNLFSLTAITFALSGCAHYLWVGANAQTDYSECQVESYKSFPEKLYYYKSSDGYTHPN